MAMAPAIVLVHSPLVGPLTWRSTTELLQARGFRVVLPSLVGVFATGPPFYPKLAARVAEAVAAIAAACSAEVEAAVFVDAILPHPGASWFDTAPSALAEHLRGLAADGWLP